MGSSIERTKGINKKDEMNNIILKENERDNLNIYVCGNKKKLIKFYEGEVIGDPVDNQQFLQKKFYDSHHKNHNWHFTFYNSDMTKELANELMNDIQNNIKYNKKNNNMVLIFFHSIENKNKINIEKNTNLFISILEIFEMMNKIYKPILLFAINKEKKYDNKDEKNDNIFEKNYPELFDIINKNNLKKNYINKYIEIAYFKKNNFGEIYKKINSIFCYYNNISDYFSLLDEIIRKGDESYHPKRNNKIRYNATFNILIIGRPGSGKSTLINLLLNKRKAKEGIGLSMTKIVSKYIHDNYPITFQDTPGFEDNKDLEKMKNFLYNVNYIFKEGKSKFHLILYIINASNERSFIGEEIELINYIKKEMKIPIFFVCTKSKNEDYAKDFEESIKLNLWQNFGEDTDLVDNIFCCQLLNEKDGIYKRFGIDNLLKNIQDYYIKEILQREKDLINKNNKKNDSKKPIFLGDIKDNENFIDYLERISNEIIKNYENFTIRQIIREKKESKNIELKNDKIHEMLVDHLALELNGERCGKDFCKENEEEIEKDIENNEELREIHFGKYTIRDKNAIKSAIITKKIGEKARNIFLKKIDNEGGLNYLKNIINDYKIAINSLPQLYEDLKKNPTL